MWAIFQKKVPHTVNSLAAGPPEGRKRKVALPKVYTSLNLCKTRFLCSSILDGNKVRQRKDCCGHAFFFFSYTKLR